MSEQNKQSLRDFIQEVWVRGNLSALPQYWTQDCLNHAAEPGSQEGLAALQDYHANFGSFLAAFSEIDISIEQLIAEGDRVVTYLKTSLRHTGPFMAIPATGKKATLASMRIDRLEGGKIAEHWSVADVAGLLQQLSVPATMH